MIALPSLINKEELIDHLGSKSFFMACVLAAAAVAWAGLAEANEKDPKHVRINVQIGQPAPVYYQRAPVQQVVVRPQPVAVYQNGYPVQRDRADYEHRGNGHAYGHRHGHRHHAHYDQPQPRYWVPAHQVWRGGVWGTVPGFFTATYVAPIPAPIYEPRPRVVHPGWLWVQGHWAWDGLEWGWTRGAWVRL